MFVSWSTQTEGEAVGPVRDACPKCHAPVRTLVEIAIARKAYHFVPIGTTHHLRLFCNRCEKDQRILNPQRSQELRNEADAHSQAIGRRMDAVAAQLETDEQKHQAAVAEYERYEAELAGSPAGDAHDITTQLHADGNHYATCTTCGWYSTPCATDKIALVLAGQH